MATSPITRVFDARFNAKTVGGFAIAAAAGVLLAAYPLTTLGAIAVPGGASPTDRISPVKAGPKALRSPEVFPTRGSKLTGS